MREGVKHASAEPPATTRGRLNSLFSGAFPDKSSCIRSACSTPRPLQGQKNAKSARIHIFDRSASIYCKTYSVPGRDGASTEWFWLDSRRMSTPRSAAFRNRLRWGRHPAQCSTWFVPCTCSRTAPAPRRWGPPQPSRLLALQLPKVPDLQNEARSAAPVAFQTADHRCTPSIYVAPPLIQ